MMILPYIKYIVGVIVILGAFLLGYHQGGQSVKLTDAKAAVKQQAANDAKRQDDLKEIEIERSAYAQSRIDPVPAPVVRLCKYTATGPVPKAAAAAGAAHAAAGNGGADPLPGPDIGSYLVLGAHRCDAQVKGLQDYITRICLAK